MGVCVCACMHFIDSSNWNVLYLNYANDHKPMIYRPLISNAWVISGYFIPLIFLDGWLARNFHRLTPDVRSHALIGPIRKPNSRLV